MPQKTDSAGKTYFDGDNIRLTAADLAWIRQTTFPPPAVLPLGAPRRARHPAVTTYHVVQFGKRA